MKIRRENPNLFKIRQKISGTLHEDIVTGDINFAINALLFSAQYFYIADNYMSLNSVLRFHCENDYANMP